VAVFCVLQAVAWLFAGSQLLPDKGLLLEKVKKNFGMVGSWWSFWPREQEVLPSMRLGPCLKLVGEYTETLMRTRKI
jgi:hypothetical protein